MFLYIRYDHRYNNGALLQPCLDKPVCQFKVLEIYSSHLYYFARQKNVQFERKINTGKSSGSQPDEVSALQSIHLFFFQICYQMVPSLNETPVGSASSACFCGSAYNQAQLHKAALSEVGMGRCFHSAGMYLSPFMPNCWPTSLALPAELS